MAKCSACGRFLGQTDGARCIKCPSVFHRSCIGLNGTAKVSSSWICPNCKPREVKGDNAETPVKALYEDCADEIHNDAVFSTSSGVADLLVELRAFREEMRALRAEVVEMSKGMTDLRDVIGSQNKRLDELDARVASLEQRNTNCSPVAMDHLEAEIDGLKQELNNRDQALLCNDIQISNLPETGNENLVHLVGLIASKIGTKLVDGDIVSVMRVGAGRIGSIANKKEQDAVSSVARPRPIAVRLARRSLRDDLIKSARVRRSITSEGLDLLHPSCSIYINERLTKYNRQLYHKARELAKAAGWKFVWTSGGRILVRRDSGLPGFQVRSVRELQRIFGSTSTV